MRSRIEMGVSTYMLSEEELKAVEVAKNNTYQPEHEKVVKVRFKPTFRKKDKDRAMDERLHWIRWKWSRWMKRRKNRRNPLSVM